MDAMNNDKNFVQPVSADDQKEHVERQDSHAEIDETDAEENHSTASDGGDFLNDPSEEPADTSEGNLPDPEEISDNEEGENDKLKISDK